MSLEKIISEAMNGNPLNVKESFEEEMKNRLLAALEEKYKKSMKAEEEDEDEDEEDKSKDDDDEDEEEDEDEDKD